MLIFHTKHAKLHYLDKHEKPLTLQDVASDDTIYRHKNLIAVYVSKTLCPCIYWLSG